MKAAGYAWFAVGWLCAAAACTGSITGPGAGGEGGGGGGGSGEPCPPGSVSVGDDCVDVTVGDALGTNWHPDSDGDGVAIGSDLCAYVYDPAQGDGDGDGVGDACDADAVEIVDGGPVADLRAEHVTPYGAWLSFTSVRDVEFSWRAQLAWSTDAGAVTSDAGFDELVAAGQALSIQSKERTGRALSRPIQLIDLEPDTTYYLAVRMDDSGAIGNVLEIRTHAAPMGALSDQHPRVFATPESLAALAARAGAGDSAWQAWREVLGDRVMQMANTPGEQQSWLYCTAAAILYHGTGETQYRDAALAMLSGATDYWAASSLGHNDYRWADAIPGICLDLLWHELEPSEREYIVSTVLADDEEHLSGFLWDDTDQVASITRTLVIDGLVACGAPGLDPALSERACAVLDRGLRIAYGVQLVKARRDRGFWAQSGGNLPDGIFYSQNTSQYWLETLYALANAGASVSAYATWVDHNLRALEIYALTPRGRGYAAFGDVESFDNDAEPNSFPVFDFNSGHLAKRVGLLDRFAMTDARGWGLSLFDEIYQREYWAFAWSSLMFERDGMTRRPYREDLPVAYLDSGMGMLYDRTSWGPDASMLVFRAGWTGVDHSHEDIGSFQLYRQGAWATHESLGYLGTASTAAGHNVMSLEVGDDARLGQVTQGTGAVRIARASSSTAYGYAAADTLGVYESDESRSYPYAAVQRHLVWLKGDEGGGADRVVVYDLVDNAAGRTGLARSWQLHVDQAPVLSSDRAEATVGGDVPQRVTVQVALPPDAQLSAREPEGGPDEFPSLVYTHRIVADPGTDPTLRMVTVVHAGNASDAAPGPAAGVDSGPWVGVVTDGRAVLFPREPIAGGRVAHQAAEVRLAADGPLTVLWTGLAPGAGYTLTSATEAGERVLSLSPGGDRQADPGGVLVFEVP